MSNFFKKLLIFCLFVFCVSALPLSAAGLGDAFKGNLTTVADTAEYKSTEIEDIIAIVIRAFLGLLGVFFLILTIYGGVLWMNAQGNDQQVEKARKLINAAVIGLLIVVSSYAVSYFVVSRIGDATLIK